MATRTEVPENKITASTMVPNPILKVSSSSDLSSNSFNNFKFNGAPSPTNHVGSFNGGGSQIVEQKTDYEDVDNKKSKSRDDNLRAFFKSFPPGFRFCPQDEELIVCYLQKRVNNEPLPRNQINEVELYKYNPEELAEKYREYGEKEWYFFTPRDRKYQNGGRPKRSAGNGYWKATGADKPIKVQGSIVGFRKALVFYEGKPPKGVKTSWIMHEYRVSDPPAPPPTRPSKNQKDTMGTPRSMRLDKCVLCRIYHKDDKSLARLTRQRDDGHPSIATSMEDDGDDGFVMDNIESPCRFILNPNTGTDHRYMTGTQNSPEMQFYHESSRGASPFDFHQQSSHLLLPHQFRGHDQFVQPISSFGRPPRPTFMMAPTEPLLPPPPYSDDDWAGAGILNLDFDFQSPNNYLDQAPPTTTTTSTGLPYDPPPHPINSFHVNVHSISPFIGDSNPSMHLKDYTKSSPNY